VNYPLSSRDSKLWAIAGLFALVSAIAVTFARAGGEGGGHVGGGTGWTCREYDGSLRWIRLVDLDEGRRLELRIPYGTEDAVKSRSIDQWLEYAEARLRAASSRYFEIYADTKAHALAKLRHVQDSSFFRTPDITGNTLRKRPDPSSCGGGVLPEYPEQIAYYDDALDTLQFNDALYDDPRFTNLDRAALLVHEVIYRMYRTHKDAQDSSETRNIVGYLFSDAPVESIREYVDPSTLLPRGEFVPAPGTFRSVAGASDGHDFWDLHVLSFDRETGVLELRQHNADTGEDGRFNRFACQAVGKGSDFKYTCKMIYSSSRWDRWLGRLKFHELEIVGPDQMIWHNVRRNSVTWITNYKRVKDAGTR
jgi:hypothetical protein